MQYTFTVTLSRGNIPDICTNVKFYKRRPMKGLLNEHKWQKITKNMALPSLWQRLSLKNVHSCSRRYFRSYIQYYCKWKMCITNYCLTFCYSSGVNENYLVEILNCLLQKTNGLHYTRPSNPNLHLHFWNILIGDCPSVTVDKKALPLNNLRIIHKTLCKSAQCYTWMAEVPRWNWRWKCCFLRLRETNLHVGFALVFPGCQALWKEKSIKIKEMLPSSAHEYSNVKCCMKFWKIIV